MYLILENKIIELLENSSAISEERKILLGQFVEYLCHKIKSGKDANLIFICTHNSRRSMMSQIWAATAAEYFQIPNVNSFSGGTEATAFNPNAVKAVERTGFKIEKKSNSENPLYLVSFSDDKEPLRCVSKVYGDPFNPQNGFAAIMTCSEADAGCPVVFGADARFPIRYDDPKEFDGTDLEELKYRERFEQIGTEMLFAFQLAHEKLSK